MSELIDRLTGKAPCNGSELQEAADRIAELEKDKAELVEALARFKPKVDGRKHSHTYSDGIISRAARILAKHKP